MEKETNESLIIIASKGVPARIAIVFAVIAALLFGWFAVRWQLGFMLAELSSPTEPNAKAIGELAVDLSPGDPLANWFLLNVARNDNLVESEQSAVQSIEKVVRLAPYRFGWWAELGRAYEQSNQPEKAEKAFLRALELAPNYTFPRWHLGNFYLRSGNELNAFSEFKKAAENNSDYRDQVFSIAWEYYDHNPQKLEELAGTTPAVRAGLAKFYAVKEKPAESLKMWNSLNAEEKQENSEVAKVIAQGLFEKRFYRQAVEFVRDLGIEPNANAESIQNAGFEESFGETDYTYFNWRTSKIDKIDIKLDGTQKHGGNRSLRVSFSTYSGGIFYDTFQIATVVPSSKYVLSFWLKTADLKSGGMPNLEVVNANSEKIIAASEPFPSGTNDWRQIKIEFTAPEDAEAITIRTSRAYCGENCPIVGTFWYDDFQLQRIG